jgi:hypothetical protein
MGAHDQVLSDQDIQVRHVPNRVNLYLEHQNSTMHGPIKDADIKRNNNVAQEK